MSKKLGKGLGALIPEDSSKAKEKIEIISLSDIVPNQFQPRKAFNRERMEELMGSIKEKGVIQPILVRQKEDKYELIAGERRWRAANELEMEEIPVIIKRDISDVSSLEISLIENIQRENFNPIEEAAAYKQLIDAFGHTLEQVGQKVAKNKTTISNSLRLLSLSQEIQRYIEDGTISVGHAKVLLSVQSTHKRDKFVQTVINHGLSVRQLEQLLSGKKDAKKSIEKAKNPEITRLEEELQHHLGTKVRIHQGTKRGRIEIQYFSNEDLQRVLGLVMGK